VTGGIDTTAETVPDKGVLVVGEALIDIVESAPGERVEHAGGSPFNVAIGLGRVGVRTTLATQLGPDPRGDLLRAKLTESGVTTVGCTPIPEHTATATATLGSDGGATYSFDLRWDPESLPGPEHFDAIHVGSLGTSVAPGAETVAELVRAASARGTTVSYDPNVRLAVEPDAERWRRVADELVPHASVVKLSDEDAAVLFPGLDIQTVALRLAAARRLAVVTSGADGLVLANSGTLVRVSARPVAVADTIGAGDSVMAAVLFWMHQRRWPDAGGLTRADLLDLGALCAAAAAITVSRPGANPPTRRELASAVSYPPEPRKNPFDSPEDTDKKSP
jgi:fructokinase